MPLLIWYVTPSGVNIFTAWDKVQKVSFNQGRAKPQELKLTTLSPCFFIEVQPPIRETERRQKGITNGLYLGD